MNQPTISSRNNEPLRDAAEILLKARRESTPIENLPAHLRPKTLEEAYYVQDVMAEALGAVGGWKVGASSPDSVPLYAPLPVLGFGKSGQTFSESFRRLRNVEAEIAFLIGKDLPARTEPYSREEVVDAIASAHPAIELIESAFIDPDVVERFCLIADLQIHGGFVAGPALADWKEVDFAKESVSVSMDGAVRYEGTASNSAGTDLLRLVTFMANEAQTRTGGLKAGDWITTGSWCGKLPALADSEVRVQFSRFGQVQVYFA